MLYEGQWIDRGINSVARGSAFVYTVISKLTVCSRVSALALASLKAPGGSGRLRESAEGVGVNNRSSLSLLPLVRQLCRASRYLLLWHMRESFRAHIVHKSRYICQLNT